MSRAPARSAPIEVTKIENKGKMNRRVNLAFVGAAP